MLCLTRDKEEQESNKKEKIIKTGPCITCGGLTTASRKYCDKCLFELKQRLSVELNKKREIYHKNKIKDDSAKTKIKNGPIMDCDCRNCGIKLNADNASINNNRYIGICKECNNRLTQQKRTKNKMGYINYKGGQCENCGYRKNAAALQFHHIDPSKKDFQLSGNVKSTLTYEIKSELDKCQLLCANCHFELHNPSMELDQSDQEKLKKPEIID